jgi:hypothetical protein
MTAARLILRRGAARPEHGVTILTVERLQAITAA